MEIRNVSALKIWIANTVSWICDAEPDDLAKYIVALLRRDKSEKELRDLCEEELQVFFRENTMDFLSQLFSALKTESYFERVERMNWKEVNLTSPHREDGRAVRSRNFLSRDDDFHSKSSRIDDKYIIEINKKQLRSDYKDVRNRLGDANLRDCKRHRDEHDRRERRKRSRSRSPVQRKRSGRYDDMRSDRYEESRPDRLRRRSRERARSPFIQSGFRSAKYFAPRPKSRSNSPEKEVEEFVKKESPAHSSSGSIELKDDKEYRITVPLDNIIRSNQSTQSNYNTYKNASEVPKETSMHDSVMHSTSDSPMVVTTTQVKSQPSLFQTAPPPLPLNLSAPPPTLLPQFSTKLIPAVQPMIVTQPPPILQHFARFPTSGNLVPSLPLGLSYQPPQIIIPKEQAGSRQVVTFTGMTSFANFAEQNSIKSRLGIKVDDHRADGRLSNTLLVNNIPPTLNNISSINQQFSKFGTITNIQVHYSGNPGLALITFGDHLAADSAYNSSEPVFNNRFIEISWHQETQRDRLVLPDARRSVKERLGGMAQEFKIQIVGGYEPTESEKENKDGMEFDGSQSENISGPADSPMQKRTVVLMPSKNAPLSSQKQQATITYSPPKVRQVSSINKKGELMKEVMKRKLDLDRKKRLFFEEQLQKQKSLLDELQKPGLSDEEKLSLKKKLNEMSLQSRKLKSELDGSMKQMKSSSYDSVFPSNISASEIKKQILDAELDLMAKAKEGADTTEYDRKIKMLKRQASIINKKQARTSVIQTFSSKPANQYFRPQKPARSAPQYMSNASSRLLDRRPKQLIVSGFPPEKKNSVISHLGRFGKMEKFEDVEGKEESIVVTYSSRKEAETVARLAVDFEDVKLLFSWPKIGVAPQTFHEDEMTAVKDDIIDEHDDDDDDSDTMIELMIEDDGTTTDLMENSLIEGEKVIY